MQAGSDVENMQAEDESNREREALEQYIQNELLEIEEDEKV